MGALLITKAPCDATPAGTGQWRPYSAGPHRPRIGTFVSPLPFPHGPSAIVQVPRRALRPRARCTSAARGRQLAVIWGRTGGNITIKALGGITTERDPRRA